MTRKKPGDAPVKPGHDCLEEVGNKWMLRLDRGIRKIGGSGKEITRSSRVMTERGAGNDKGEKGRTMTA